jgi:hypothetical protein
MLCLQSPHKSSQPPRGCLDNYTSDLFIWIASCWKGLEMNYIPNLPESANGSRYAPSGVLVGGREHGFETGKT